MRRLALAVGIVVALIESSFGSKLIKPFLLETPLKNFTGGVSIALYLIDIVFLVAIILALAPRNRPPLLKLSGLSAPILRPLLFALLLFAPAAAVAAWQTSLATNFDAFDLVYGGLLFPAFEEIGYRGLAIGALMALCGWRFLYAALLPAALFGLAHFWQGRSPEEVAGVLAVTAAGGLLFGWLFVRWGFNLWPPMLLHMGLNLLWTIFALGETALGGWLGNALRIGVVAGAIALTFLMAPKPTPQ